MLLGLLLGQAGQHHLVRLLLLQSLVDLWGQLLLGHLHLWWWLQLWLLLDLRHCTPHLAVWWCADPPVIQPLTCQLHPCWLVGDVARRHTDTMQHSVLLLLLLLLRGGQAKHLQLRLRDLLLLLVLLVELLQGLGGLLGRRLHQHHRI